MASEITITAALSFRKGGTVAGIDPGPLTATFAGTNFLQHRQTVGTSEEAINLGDVAGGGWVFAVNRDGVNYVILKGASGQQGLIRIGPGELALFRLELSAAAPFVQANGAPVEIEFFIMEA